MNRCTAAVVLSVLLAMPDAFAQARQPATSKPDAAAKKCQAAQRRVERQKEVITELDARIERDSKARESCKTKRACEGLDRALKASETRKKRYDSQLAQYASEAQLACIK